jgi:hypothetical protein
MSAGGLSRYCGDTPISLCVPVGGSGLLSHLREHPGEALDGDYPFVLKPSAGIFIYSHEIHGRTRKKF